MQVTQEQRGDDIIIVNNIIPKFNVETGKYTLEIDAATITELQQGLRKLEQTRTYSRTARVRKGNKQRTFVEYRIMLPTELNITEQVTRPSPIVSENKAQVPIPIQQTMRQVPVQQPTRQIPITSQKELTVSDIDFKHQQVVYSDGHSSPILSKKTDPNGYGIITTPGGSVPFQPKGNYADYPSNSSNF